MSTSTLIRLSKALLSLAMGLLATLVVFNNLTDYWTNYHFVAHVMSMDTVFPESTTRRRAMNSPRLFHLAYATIIAVETLIAWLCSAGGLAMLGALKADGKTFHESKRLTIAGLLSALMLWFTAFQGIAAEWFGMWMSEQWNGLPGASRLTQIISTLLVFVSMKNDE